MTSDVNNTMSLHSCGCYFDTHIPPKRFCTLRVHFCGNCTPSQQWAPWQDIVPCSTTKMAQEWLNKHNKDSQVTAQPSNSPDQNLIRHLWYLLEQANPSRSYTQQPTGCLCQIPQGTLGHPCPDGLNRFGSMAALVLADLQIIRQVLFYTFV